GHSNATVWKCTQDACAPRGFPPRLARRAILGLHAQVLMLAYTFHELFTQVIPHDKVKQRYGV
nr:hypothetical protein [Acidobacteriota bacterium]